MKTIYGAYVSLGGICVTAESLGKYGFRDFSGPFDWCVSDFKGVIEIMKNDFNDFLIKENQVVSDVDSKVFKDPKYGFIFNHDIARGTFEEEWVDIKRKYNRRINRLKVYASKSPVCFIRCVRNQNEVDYIYNNSEDIEQAIKKWNSSNHLIFITLKNHIIPNDFPFMYYRTNLYSYHNHFKAALAKAFDSVPEFVDFCKNHYDEEQRQKNIAFYNENTQQYKISCAEIENKAIEEIKKIEEKKYISDLNYRIMRMIYWSDKDMLEIPVNGIDIYGAGPIGKILSDKIGKGCVKSFVDRDKKKAGVFESIPIVSLDEYEPEEGRIIVITPIHAFETISSILEAKYSYKDLNIVGIDTFLQAGLSISRMQDIMG